MVADVSGIQKAVGEVQKRVHQEFMGFVPRDHETQWSYAGRLSLNRVLPSSIIAEGPICEYLFTFLRLASNSMLLALCADEEEYNAARALTIRAGDAGSKTW